MRFNRNRRGRRRRPRYLREGNAFVAARAKAIQQGKSKFTVDGETYPVTNVDDSDRRAAKKLTDSFMYLDEYDNYLHEEQKINPNTKKFLKGMKKIKVNGLSGWMPGVKYVYFDGKKIYIIDNEGDYLEVRNKGTLDQLYKKHGIQLSNAAKKGRTKTKIKVNGLDGYLPHHEFVFFDGEKVYTAELFGLEEITDKTVLMQLYKKHSRELDGLFINENFYEKELLFDLEEYEDDYFDYLDEDDDEYYDDDYLYESPIKKTTASERKAQRKAYAKKKKTAAYKKWKKNYDKKKARGVKPDRTRSKAAKKAAKYKAKPKRS